MPSMEHLYRFRAKSQNNEKSNTELELFELENLLPIVEQQHKSDYRYITVKGCEFVSHQHGNGCEFEFLLVITT